MGRLDNQEQAVIRSRMASLEEKAKPLGREGRAIAQQAIGRAYLALHEYQPAYEHLKESLERGNQSVELHYALGRVLGVRYFEALRAARRHGNGNWLEQRRKFLENELLRPAMLELERSRGIQLESTSYLNGLLAFYKGQYEEALHQADQALIQAPWLYEANKLKGDIYYRRAATNRFHGNLVQVDQDLNAALRFYEEATAVGRSDEELYEARGDALLLKMEIEKERSGKPSQLMATALSVAADAIRISPDRTRGYQQMALLYQHMAEDRVSTGSDPREAVQKLVAAAQQGLSHDPTNAEFYDLLAVGYLYTIDYEENHGLPLSMPIDQVILYQEKSISMNPEFPYPHNDLAGMYLFRAHQKMAIGTDPYGDLEKGIRSIEQAIRLEPNYPTANANVAYFHYLYANSLLEQGRNPQIEIELAERSIKECIRLAPKKVDCYINLALVRLIAARHASMDFQRRVDFPAEIKSAISSFETAGQYPDLTLDWYQNFAAAHLLRAQFLYKNHEDPEAAITEAEHALAMCHKQNSEDSDCAAIAAQLAVLKAQGSPVRPLAAAEQQRHYQQALGAAEAAVKGNPRSAEAKWVLAEVRLARARSFWQQRQRAAALAELQAGQAAVEQGLLRNQRLARALLVRGELQLLSANLAATPAEKKQLAQAALMSLDRALEANALLKEDASRSISEARQLLADGVPRPNL